MPFVTTQGGTEIVDEEWGRGQPHGMRTTHVDVISPGRLAFIEA